MKKKKITISVGIPAYNEAQNIEYLLKALLQQRLRGALLKEIIVVSDGSTDNTAAIVASIKDKRIVLQRHHSRRGIVTSQNEIVKRATGSILVLLDADVLPMGNYFLTEIIAPIKTNPNVGLVGGDTISTPANTWFERIIADSHELKQSMYLKINNGNNVYLCHGRARGLSKAFYRQLVWPNNIPEDAFSYLMCLKLGYQFVFATRAKVLFRSPAIVSDHIKQSRRFNVGKKKLEEHFSQNFIREQYKIPWKILFNTLLSYFFKKPLTTVAYVVLSLILKYLPGEETYQSRWKVAVSSKKVVT